MVMFALLLSVVVGVVVGLWAARRYLASVAWARELEAAFDVADRQEMPNRPVL